MARPLVEHKLRLLRDRPGCYEMFNSHNKIIYVGKSKDLKHRVRSYFKAHHTGKVGEMVSRVFNFRTIYVDTDKESYLLEITLIQKYRPYFNIQLKQGHNTYPYIEITKERNPRMTMTNKMPDTKKGWFFGPYPERTAAERTLRFLEQVYPLRRCHGNTHGRPCTYYHIGECIGCCFKKIPKSVYLKRIGKIKSFLNGNCTHAKRLLTQRMQKASQNLQFEQAERYKKLLMFIEQTVEKQKIISHDYTPRDIFNYYSRDGWVCIQVFYLRQARLMKRIREFYPIMGSVQETVVLFIIRFYKNFHNIPPKEILVPRDIPKDVLHDELHIQVKTPLRGQKHSLLKMAYDNAKISLDDKFRLMTFNHQDTQGAAKELGAKLGIGYPKNIDSFDIADIQGFDITGACVVFTDGKPNKKLFRKYKLHTGHADERAGMIEMLTRRYTKKVQKHQALPNLILMDGGRVQVNAALTVLRDKLALPIPVAGMVKNAKHQTDHLIYKQSNGLFYRVPLVQTSPTFFLLTRIQDRIHDLVINYHRTVHRHHEFQSQLTTIQGVGQRTSIKLLRHFGSIHNIAKATPQQLHVLGISKKVAENIKLSLS